MHRGHRDFSLSSIKLIFRMITKFLTTLILKFLLCELCAFSANSVVKDKFAKV